MAKLTLKPDFAKDSNGPVTGFTNNYTKLRYSNNEISESTDSGNNLLNTHKNIDQARVYEIDGEFWFAGNDVASIIGYKYPKCAIRNNVEKDNKMAIKMSELIKYRSVDKFEYESPFRKIRTTYIDGEEWFSGKDLSDVLGYKSIHSAIIKHVDDENKRKISISDLNEYNENNPIPDHMKGSRMTMINKKGISSLILKSEKLSKSEKEKFLNMFGTGISVYSRKEIEFKYDLSEMFRAINMNVITQYSIGNYRADFYIPELNVVIEYDENEHKRYDDRKEKERENYIKNTLKCKIIRINDKETNSFNLGVIVKELFVK